MLTISEVLKHNKPVNFFNGIWNKKRKQEVKRPCQHQNEIPGKAQNTK